MPLGAGVRYRVKTYPSGKRVRLAFRGGKAIEAKSMRDVLADNIRRRKSRRRKK